MVSDDGGGRVRARSPPKSSRVRVGTQTKTDNPSRDGRTTRRRWPTHRRRVVLFRERGVRPRPRVNSRRQDLAAGNSARQASPSRNGGKATTVADRVGRSKKATRGRSPPTHSGTPLGGGGAFENRRPFALLRRRVRYRRAAVRDSFDTSSKPSPRCDASAKREAIIVGTLGR